jgi:O-antigen/teichoic acid export membrane protein
MGSIYRQSTALFISNILLLVGGYGFKIYLARSIGAEGLGLFALGESLMALVRSYITQAFRIDWKVE